MTREGGFFNVRGRGYIHISRIELRNDLQRAASVLAVSGLYNSEHFVILCTVS